MAAGRFVVPPYFPARDRDFNLLSGALLYVYENETTTKTNIYTDVALTVLSSNPVVANSSGQFPAIYAEAGTEASPVLYSVSVTTSTGASPGNPFNFDNYRPSVDWETAASALAEAAAEVAIAEAANAAQSAASAESIYEDILAIEATGSDAAAIATRAKLDGSNFTGSQPEQFRAAIGAVGLVALAASDGDELIGTIQSGTGAVAMTQGLRNSESVSVLDFVPANLRAAIRAGPSGVDVSSYIQAALNAHLQVHFPTGFYRLEDQLEPRSGQVVIATAGVTIRQYASETPIFYALSKDNMTFLLGGALLYGKGFWDPTWTSAADHFDRAFSFYDCDNYYISGARTRDFGVAGFFANGGTGGYVQILSAEGTNNYTTPLPSNANHQMGIYLSAAAPYGAPSGVIFDTPDISGTAQGVLCELPSTGAQSTRLCEFNGATIHDIPSQHGFYCQFPIVINGAVLTDIELSGVKLQSTIDNNQDLHGFSASGIFAKNLGSSMLEAAQINGTADITGVYFQGVGVNVAIGLAATGRVSGRADIVVDGCDSVASITGAGVDFDIIARGTGTNSDAFIVTATSAKVNIWPSVTDVLLVAGDANSSAFNIASASAVVNIYDPYIVAASGSFMKYGITNKVAGTTVTVHGQPSITGSATALLLETAPIKYSDWRSWTPTYSSTGGSLTTMTTNTAKYIYLTPTTIAFDLDVTFTDAGTATGDFFATLPATAANPFCFSGFDQQTTGVSIVCRVRPADLTKASIVSQVNAATFVAGAALDPATTMGTGRRIVMSGTYHIA